MTALNSEKLRQLRIAAHLTERRLARLTATSPLRIRRLETGIGHPQVTLALLDRLAVALRTNPADLLDGQLAPNDPPASPPLPLRPALTILEARLLHQANTATLALPGRGPRRLAADHLTNLGALQLDRSNPTATATLLPHPDVIAAITGHAPHPALRAERPRYPQPRPDDGNATLPAPTSQPPPDGKSAES